MMFYAKWIVQKKYDLLFFSLPCLISLFIFSLYNILSSLQGLNLDTWVLGIYIIFDSLFDSPHIIQGFSRTHKDQSQYLKFKFFFKWGFLALLIIDGLIFYKGFKDQWMIFFAIIGYYHIMKQNIGFIKAYKSVNKDYQYIDQFFDISLYQVLFLSSGLHYFINSKYSFLFFLNQYIPKITFIIIFLIGFIFYFLRQLTLYNESKLNIPKNILYISTVLTNFIIHLDPNIPLALIIVMETIYHDIQYQGWIRHYQKHYFQEKEPHVLRNWFAFSMFYGVIAVVLINFFENNKMVQMFEVIFLTLILFHYLSDGFIWKFSKDPELKKLLR